MTRKIRAFVLIPTLILLQFSFGYSQNKDFEAKNSPDSLEHISKVWDRFSVRFGGFMAGYNSGITIGSKQLGLGLVIDIEDALGLKVSSFAFRGNAEYKFGDSKRHTVMVGYFGINRNAKKILEDSLQLGEIIYPIGTEITSKFDLSIIRLKYDYAFYQDDRVSIGATFGLFIMPVNFSVKAPGAEDQITNFTAPLPLIGLRTDFQINNKLYLRQSAELLYLPFETFTGSLLDLSIMLEHKTFKNIGFGLGINSNRLNITIKNVDSKIDFFGDVRMDYTGLLFYGRYFF